MVDLPGDLVAWIEEIGVGRVAAADRQPGGGRKEAWFVDLEPAGGGAPRALFLRYDRSDPARTKDPWTVQREAGFYRGLQATEVPVAPFLGVHPTLQAMLSERVIGGSWFSRITDPAEQDSTARHFMECLAALHRADPSGFAIPGVERPASVSDGVRRELDELDAVLSGRGGDVDPALRFTLAWLRRTIPGYDGPVVVVQGDTGPGNFMYAHGRVVAVVDWELAHFGDPMDDIAWLTLRSTQEPFTDLPARLREYEALSGNAIDEDRVRYYQVMAEAKIQVMGHRGAGSAERAEGGLGADLGNGIIYGYLHRRLWLEALTTAVGIDQTPAEVPPAAERRDHTWLYGALLDQLKVVVPRIEDPLAQARSKGFARVIKLLAATDAHGGFYEACELDDLTKLLGERPASLPEGRRAAVALTAGGGRELDYLSYLWRRTIRDNELARPAMGALADRHWPALR